ncbi:MAG TPA: YkgJ family cysteine cluster protein [Stellaceae bacterium]|nr:YkgJ family cysteine cluster protein [Stellaceae bacterium]
MTVGTPLECEKCAMCCKMAGYVEVSNYDIKRLAKHLGLEPKAFEEKHLVHVTRAGKKWLKDEHETCQFLGANHACTVYAARPTPCRGYVCWDQDDKTIYEFARFAQWTTGKLREKEQAEAKAEGRKLRKPRPRAR